jgi:alanine racemase
MPCPEYTCSVDFKPVMHFKGEVLQIREMPHRMPISYGRTYYTEGHQKIAVTSAGYGDGLPRSLSDKGKALIGGNRVNIVGKVCMNMTMVEISGIADITPGAEVVYLGSQGEACITGDAIAGWAQSVAYEVFCSIGQRNSKEYIQ